MNYAKSKTVYVVIRPELGWDSIVGIFDTSKVTLEDVLNRFPKDEYIILDKEVDSSFDNWD